MFRILLTFGCYISTISSLTCIETIGNGAITNGLRLVRNTITHFQPSGLMMCAKECVLYADCMSWNFEKSSLTCELSFETLHSKPEDSMADLKWLYGLREEWKHIVKGPCANHTCALHTKCIVISNDGHHCAIQGCGKPSNLPLFPADMGYHKVGASISHQVNDKKVHLKCQHNGKWKYEEEREPCVTDPLTPIPMTLISMNRSGGGYAVYGCPHGFTGQLTYECVESGTWKTATTCGAPWCPDPGYQFDLRLKMCYQIFQLRKDYDQAVSACSPGHLITIDSQERHSFLEKTINSLNLTAEYIRIDGKRQDSHGGFKDHKGRFLLFASQKLTLSAPVTVNYLAVVADGSKLTWHYVGRNDTLWYICQRDQP